MGVVWLLLVRVLLRNLTILYTTLPWSWWIWLPGVREVEPGIILQTHLVCPIELFLPFLLLIIPSAPPCQPPFLACLHLVHTCVQGMMLTFGGSLVTCAAWPCFT